MKAFRRLLIAVAASSAILAVQPSQAAEVLVNGGFETGTLTGWTANPGFPNVRVVSLSDTDGSLYVHDGTYGVFLDTLHFAPGTDASVVQQVSLPGAGSYVLSGYLRAFLYNDQTSGNFDQIQVSLQVSGNNVVGSPAGGSVSNVFSSFTALPSTSGLGFYSAWLPFSLPFTYNGSGNGIALVNFNLQNQNNTRITAAAGDTFSLQSAPVAAPEPASLALIGLGLAGFAWSRRRAGKP